MFWQRFRTSDPQDHLWYYRSLVETYEARAADDPGLAGLARELRAGLTELVRLVEDGDAR